MDDIKAIRDALAACPHKGTWLHRAKSNGLFSPPPEGSGYTYGAYITTLGDDEAQDGDVIDYIAACHPERIARLLDALEAAQRDAARYRWFRSQETSGELDSVVDAAMAASAPQSPAAAQSTP